MKCENLEVWKKSCQVSIELYKYFADCKDFGFKDQITRSGLSIASNIAEGLEKQSIKEQIRFLDISKGSAAELQTKVYIGEKISYIDIETSRRWNSEIKNILKMTTGLQNKRRLEIGK